MKGESMKHRCYLVHGDQVQLKFEARVHVSIYARGSQRFEDEKELKIWFDLGNDWIPLHLDEDVNSERFGQYYYEVE
jgi:hypothetical protein